MRRGQLRQWAEALLCGIVTARLGRRRCEGAAKKAATLERFMHVPAPGFVGE
jgi:hypothetical protein